MPVTTLDSVITATDNGLLGVADATTRFRLLHGLVRRPHGSESNERLPERSISRLPFPMTCLAGASS